MEPDPPSPSRASRPKTARAPAESKCHRDLIQYPTNNLPRERNPHDLCTERNWCKINGNHRFDDFPGVRGRLRLCARRASGREVVVVGAERLDRLAERPLAVVVAADGVEVEVRVERRGREGGDDVAAVDDGSQPVSANVSTAASTFDALSCVSETMPISCREVAGTDFHGCLWRWCGRKSSRRRDVSV